MNYKKLTEFLDEAYAYDYFLGNLDVYLKNGNKVCCRIQRDWQLDDFIKQVNERKLQKRAVHRSGSTGHYFVEVCRRQLNFRAYQ